MSYNLSGCVFIRNTFKGAFCLFESMYQLLPLCDEFIVMDLGSDDGTLEVLKEIEAANPKVKVVMGRFHKQDAAVFADLANELVAMCHNPNVLYYQADEVWHQDLVKITRQRLDEGKRNLSFWRVQLKYNFQRIKWFPHPVHRIAPKDKFHFDGDGMNTKEVYGVEMTTDAGYIVNFPFVGTRKYRMGEKHILDSHTREYEMDFPLDMVEIKTGKLWDIDMFLQWGDKYKNDPIALPTYDMILDVSLTGGFLDNIPDRRRMHLPFWGEGDVMPGDEGGLPIDQWYNQQSQNPEWDLHSTKFDIPEIMQYHLGRRKYTLRTQLLEALKVM